MRGEWNTESRPRVDLANEEKAAVSCALQGRRIFAKTTKIQSLPPRKRKSHPQNGKPRNAGQRR